VQRAVVITIITIAIIIIINFSAGQCPQQKNLAAELRRRGWI
jgi:hypothetical protein